LSAAAVEATGTNKAAQKAGNRLLQKMKRSQLTILDSVTGTRVTLRTVLASLAEGSSFDEILKDYPSLSEDQLRAVVAFAAAIAKEDLSLLPVPTLE
jgi:Protein of unknown function (DUF433)